MNRVMTRTHSGVTDGGRVLRTDRRATSGHTGLRLTRRGRRVRRILGWCGLTSAVAVVVASLVLALSAVLAPGAQAGDGRSAEPAEVVVTVAPGDSLWSLAELHQPDRDPRQVVSEIERRNGLAAGALVQVGTRLQVPTA